MAASNKNAYRLRDILPRDGAGASIDTLHQELRLGRTTVYSLLKQMQMHNLARCSETDMKRRTLAYWWACGNDSDMPKVFGIRVLNNGAPELPNTFGRYASVWDYGQGRVY